MHTFLLSMLLLASTFTKTRALKNNTILEIDCVGNCEIHTVAGNKLSLTLEVPDSIRDHFGIKEKDDKIVCGMIKQREEDSSIEIHNLKELLHLFPDSFNIHIKIGLPEDVFFSGVDINAGLSKVTMMLSKYSIKLLELNMGAGKAKVNFLNTNLTKGKNLILNLGASSLYLTAPENFKPDTMEVNAGAGKIVFNVIRKPVKPIFVDLNTALTSFTMIIPQSTTCNTDKVSETTLALKDLDACNREKKPDITFKVHSALSSIDVIKEKGK